MFSLRALRLSGEKIKKGVFMNETKKTVRCAVYTRKSTSEGLEKDFTTLDAQREAALNYIASQKSHGWIAAPRLYDDGGFTGANLERPALHNLIDDIKSGQIDCVVVYKVDRLSRSLLDFSKLLEFFEAHKVTFVSVTQHFNTNSSMGRLTLNILLSFAQFEREMISERTRDKMNAAKKRGKWLGGYPMLGYNLDQDKKILVINEQEAKVVHLIFKLYLKFRSFMQVARILNKEGYKAKQHKMKTGKILGSSVFNHARVQHILKSPLYIGKILLNNKMYSGLQKPIISEEIFNKVQELIHLNNRNKTQLKRTACVGLLSGILRCKHCNTAMFYTYTVKNNKYRHNYYVCTNAQKKGYYTCSTRSFKAEIIEKAVIDSIKKMLSRTPIQQEFAESLNNALEKQLNLLLEEQIKTKNKYKNLSEHISAIKHNMSSCSEEKLAQLKDELEKHQHSLSDISVKKSELEEKLLIKNEIQKALSISKPVWDTLFSAGKKRYT